MRWLTTNLCRKLVEVCLSRNPAVSRCPLAGMYIAAAVLHDRSRRNRKLPTLLAGNDNTMSVDRCMLLAQAANLNYFAVQGNNCWAGGVHGGGLHIRPVDACWGIACMALHAGVHAC